MAGYIGRQPVTQASRYTRQFTATQDQTTFNVEYVRGMLDVFRNGVLLVPGGDYTADDGSTIALTESANADDAITTIAWGTFQLANPDFPVMPSIEGVPLVESGSNSDGEWIRFQDGTQICTQQGITASATASTTVSYSWTLPNPFVSREYLALLIVQDPVDFSGTERAGVPYQRDADQTATFCQPGLLGSGDYTIGDTLVGNVFAIGRWK